jgi:organic radical activating enzyme
MKGVLEDSNELIPEEVKIISTLPNNNETLKETSKQGELLPLMEEFYTIQGEGFNTGKAAYFIRLGGCDVGCHWCDVKESWDPNLHPLTPTASIIENAGRYPARSVVITGGEPLTYNLDILCTGLKAGGIKIFLETSGAYPLSGSWDWICLSPKKFKAPLPEVIQKADELKVIVYNESDFKWAEKFRKDVSPTCKLYLQPEWSHSEKMIPKIVKFVMDNPHWEISLQTHKYLHIP